MWKRLQGLSKKFLSRTGKTGLIKSVAIVIPSSCMSTFLLPKTLSDKLQKIMNSFWWGTKKDGRTHRCLCSRTENGGSGFCHLYNCNIALLGKQGWTLLTLNLIY